MRAQNLVLVSGRGGRSLQWKPLMVRLGRRYLSQLKLKGYELSVLLVGDRTIKKLNRDWRRKNKATDVLSFPAGNNLEGIPGPRPLGDIVISLETARRQAVEYDRTLEKELARYLAHGLLHLLGYDHERNGDALKMGRLEAKLL